MSTRARTLHDDERRAWLRLARSESIGPITFAALLARYPDPRDALDAAPRLARRGGGQMKIPSDAEAAKELEDIARLGGRVIASREPEFPAGLAALEAPPPMITVLGDAALLKRDMVAVVGARNASGLGIKFARRIAQDLGAAGFVVASGMARGIDAAAHDGALGTGTVAVTGGGPDIIYPPANAALYEAIRRQGAIVSEMALGTAPLARHFPRRNRIVSGLSRGVVVVEAAERSGSLITANFALEQGREVFAVPGSPLDPRAKGTNRLIREGATLTEGIDDVLAVLEPILRRRADPGEQEALLAAPEAIPDQDADRVRLLVEEKLSPSPVETDELIRQCGAPAAAVLTVLLELELAGRIARHAGNRVSWR
jgi:DNA processing protein